ncbi:MAG: hypothetical protein AAF493_26530, partial [Pseudomonadota bacterium]
MSASLLAPPVREALAAMNLDFEVLPCEAALADTEVFCDHYGFLVEHSANTIVVTSKTGEKKFAACVLLAHTRV